VKRSTPVSYQGFQHLFLVGLGRVGIDASIRMGLNQFRGRTHNWFFHNLHADEFSWQAMKAGEQPCDLVIGKVFDTEMAERLRDLGRPVLDFGPHQWNPAWDTHHIDWEQTGRRGGEIFLEKGFRHAAYFSSAIAPEHDLIWKGFSEYLMGKVDSLVRADRGRKQITQLLPERTLRPYEKTSAWLLSLPEPAALLLDSDHSAENLCSIAWFNEIRIPEQLSLLGIGNDSLLCESCMPALSSLELPSQKLGYALGEHAHAVLSGTEPQELQRFAPSRMLERHSTELTAVEDPIVARALGIMREEACQRTTLGEIISRLPISPRSFHTHFTQAMGRSPKEELFRIRVELARERLLDTRDTILHISMDCGFSDTDSFVRIFKRATGMTPTQYRKTHIP